MGLENETGRLIYLNIRKGKIVHGTKDNKKESSSVAGVITKVEFVPEEYQGRKFEKAKITIVDGASNFVLQMGTDSGYFRGFCNSLRNGDFTSWVKISPNFKETDGKKRSTCFVEQNGKSLKHTFTKDNPGDLPAVEKVIFKGEEHYDGSKQMAYWKNWLSSVKWAVPEVSQPEVQAEETVAGGDNDDLPI